MEEKKEKIDVYKTQQGKNYIAVNMDFAKSYGLNTACVLAVLAYRARSFEGSFFYTMENLSSDCGLFITTVRSSVKKLQDLGIVTIVRRGIPAKLWYDFSIEKLKKLDIICKDKIVQEHIDLPECKHDPILSNNNTVNEESNTKNYSCSNTNNNDLQSMQGHGTAVGARTLFPSNDKKDEPIKQKKSNPLLKKIDSPFYKIIQWMISDDNNKDLPFSRHRLPDERKPNPTKLIVRCVEYLEQYAKGEFGKDKIIDSNWKPYLQFSMSFDEVKRDVERAVTNFRTALNEAYLPVNKEFLRNIPLDAWFYNGNTQRSWFYELVHNPPKLKSEMLAGQIKEQLPPVLDKVFSRFYMTDKSPKEELEYWQNLKTIYEKWKWLVSDMKYGDWYRNTQWLNYFRGLEQWCLTYFDFIKDFQHPLHILSIYSDTWKKYENYVWKEHRVELSPGEKTIEKLKKRQEEEVKETEEKRYKLMLSQASIAWKKNLEQFDAEDETIDDDARTEYLLSSYLYNCIENRYTEKMYEYAKKLLPQAYEYDGSIKERFKEYDEPVFMKQFDKRK